MGLSDKEERKTYELRPQPLIRRHCRFIPDWPVHAQTINTRVIEWGPHHRVIESVDADGSTNTFTQLQTGLNRWSEADKQFVPASDEAELINGVAIARKAQFQVIFGTTLDALEGTVDLMMLGGQRFRARPMGLAYTEFKGGQPGPSVFVAETKGVAFDVTGRSEVTYPDALTGGASGSIRYRMAIGGLERDHS